MHSPDTVPSETLIIVPSGMLGAGVLREQMRHGITLGAHAIAVDAGSTDSGPPIWRADNPK